MRQTASCRKEGNEMSMEIGSAAYNRVSVERNAEQTRVKRAEQQSEASATDTFTRTAESEQATGGEGAIYSGSVSGRGYTVDAETIERLRSENEARMANLVQQMLGKQISRNNVLEAIKAGQFSAEDIEQAKKDVADDGYWGVEQTSDRIVQFATALTGGDPDKLDSMIEAFEKGYAEAEKQWGGELPELSQRTREAVLEKFRKLKDQYAGSDTPVAQVAQISLEAAAQKAAREA